MALKDSSVSMTYDIAASAEMLGAPSERWLIEKLRTGQFPGRKVGRHWRMTDADITEALDVCSNRHRRPKIESTRDVRPPDSGLTPTSRRRLCGGGSAQ